MKVKQVFKKHLPLILIFGVLFIIPILNTPNYALYMIEKGMQNALVVVGLVVLLGYTGLLSMGHAGMIAIGAYAYAIMTGTYSVPPLIAFIVAPVFSGIIGLVLSIPSFKLSGPYLVVVTVAFGEIVRILIQQLEITGGPFGIKDIASIASGIPLYYLIAAVLLLLSVFVIRLGKSHIGLALKSIKENEVMAAAMGIDIKKYKMLAFVFSSVVAGISGVLLTQMTGYINPDSFTAAESTTHLLMLVLGGMSSVPGALISALLLTLLPEALRFMIDGRLLVYAAIVLIVLRFSPSFDKLRKKIADAFKKKGACPSSAGK